MGAFEEKIGLVNTKEGGWEMTKEPLGSGGGCEGDSGSHPVGVLVFWFLLLLFSFPSFVAEEKARDSLGGSHGTGYGRYFSIQWRSDTWSYESWMNPSGKFSSIFHNSKYKAYIAV